MFHILARLVKYSPERCWMMATSFGTGICKESECKANVWFFPLLHSPVTLGVTKLFRKSLWKNYKHSFLPRSVSAHLIGPHQTGPNGQIMDPLITYATLMRFTPLYWLLFACFVTLLPYNSPPTPLPSTQRHHPSLLAAYVFTFLIHSYWSQQW